MIRDFMAREIDINLSLPVITGKAEVDLETQGNKNYLVHNDGGTSTVLAEFTDASDLTIFNKDDYIKVVEEL